MTGFGHAEAIDQEVSVEVSVRAVNGRHLDLRVHTPKHYLSFEPEIKKQVASTHLRGTIDVYITRRTSERISGEQVTVKVALAKAWVKSYAKLAKDLKLKNDLQLATVVARADVLVVEDRQEISADEKKMVFKTIRKALIACDHEKTREGQFLKKQIGELLTSFYKTSEQIEVLRESANKRLSERFLQRLKNLNYEGDVDSQRLAQELVMQVEKSDINEEITRLREHVQRMSELIQKPGPAGKKLDFYTQELLREINTIGSKSALSELTEKVVDAKSTIEQIREQVQNIE